MAVRDKIKIIAVVGPTASGKTALGVELAKALNGEVVSCDSMQVYKGMDIATAKPTKEETGAVKHHLIDFVEPSEEYNVARFCADAKRAIDDIVGRGKQPIIVGGTGLYITSLIDGVKFDGGDYDPLLRQALYNEAEQKGNQALLDRIMQFDPEYGAKLHVNDLKRIVRALEVYTADGVKMSERLALSKSGESEYDAVIIGITYKDRAKLYERINLRVDKMVADGLVNEARACYGNDIATADQAIGHKELEPYFEGKASLEDCIDNLKMQTRRYAKRQLSWFGRDKRINWIFGDEREDMVAEAIKILQKREEQ